jgi:hypothetical protein
VVRSNAVSEPPIVVVPNDETRRQLATAIAQLDAAIVVRARHDVGQQATMWVVTSDGGDLPQGSVIALTARTSLRDFVQMMQASPNIVGVIDAAGHDSRSVAALVAHASGNPVNLSHVAEGTIGTERVADYDAKVRCLARLSAVVERLGSAALRESIIQCIDELVMNGLYDAPRDAGGRALFRGVPIHTRVRHRTEHEVVVRHVCDGERFAVSVSDAFGSLERQTMLEHLRRGLHDEQPVGRQPGGAGLGLYLIANAASELWFVVQPGSATDVVCVFDVRARGLRQLGFCARKKAGPPARSARVMPSARQARRRRLGIAASALAVLTGAVTAFVAWPRPTTRDVTIQTTPAGATIELDGRRIGTTSERGLVARDLVRARSYTLSARLEGHEVRDLVVDPSKRGSVEVALQPVPRLLLDTEPSGAAVAIDGVSVGTTPAVIDSLAPDRSISVTFEKLGYLPATAHLDTPPRGEDRRHVEDLERADTHVRVHIRSDPPGALVLREGETISADRTYTPAEVMVEVDRLHRFVLVMPGHAPLALTPFVALRANEGMVTGGQLAPGATLRVESSRPGHATVADVPHCQQLRVPFACPLATGTYEIVFEGLDGTRLARSVTLGSTAVIERF